ncbi:hypothetical protein [Methylobacter luteus]|uniref:hypothetical protein n=1 Tax=Methylobacter luteus TaxID=415 RepID=UPI00048002E9|nr:hypothetical protein [Methylobacter luteus]
MRTNLDLFVMLTGLGLFYWGLKILVEEGKKLDVKYFELSKKQKMMNPIAFLLYVSPFTIAYLFIGQYPQYAVESLMFSLFYLFVILGTVYLRQVKKLTTLGYPSSYINKFRISQVLTNLGILLIIGLQLIRLVQRHG